MEESKEDRMIAKVTVGKPIGKKKTDQIVVPIAIPDLDDVRKLAAILHEHGKPYRDTVWGWPVSYSPMRPEPVPDSTMTFTPADMFVGIWPIWWVSFMWENGDDQPPNVTIGDELVRD